MKEIWKPIAGHGFYEVSNLGRVRSLPHTAYRPQGPLSVQGKVLKPQRCGNGKAMQVTLYTNGKSTNYRLHHLVIVTFVGERPDGQECRHLDGDFTNNRLDNLAWGTRKENVADAMRHGTFICGERHKNAKLTASQVREIRRRHGSGETAASISKDYPVAASTILDIAARKKWRHVA